MENGKIEALVIDGPAAARVVQLPNAHSFQLLHDFENCFNFGSGRGVDLARSYSNTIYHVYTYGESDIDEAFTFWVFPDRGRFVQWESSDLDWARPICRVAPIRVYKKWHVASTGRAPLPYHAATVRNKLAPCVRYAVDVQPGWVLPIDTSATRVLEILNRQSRGVPPCIQRGIELGIRFSDGVPQIIR